MKIYLDDVRSAPDGFTLDHDLGTDMTGYNVVCEMEDFVFNTRPLHMPYIHVHSANPIGRDNGSCYRKD